VLAGSVSLQKRGAREERNFGLGGGSNCRGEGAHIHLRETRAATGLCTAFGAHSDEDSLRAGGCNARRAGVDVARNSADERCAARRCIRVNKVDALRAKIGDDQVRIIWRQRESAKAGVGRRTSGRLNWREELAGSEIENVHMIDAAEIDALPT